MTCFHPRFGRIPGLRTLVDARAGEELFTHYKYELAVAAEWYLFAEKAFNSRRKKD